MKRLMDDKETYNKAGVELYAEFSAAIEPIIDKWMGEYSSIEIEHITTSSLDQTIFLKRILRAFKK